jgi:xanthine dehydrogenase accessory factor
MDLIDRMRELRAEGKSFVLATVVRVERPTSAKPGAKAIVTQDGALTGWIGGSCTEPHVIREAAEVMAEGKPRLLRLCPPEKMHAASEEGVSEVRITCMSGGTLEIYLEPYLPQPHLLVVGHQAVAESLATLGSALGYRVSVMGENASLERFSNADQVWDRLDFSQVELTPNTYVVVTSHGNYDELALEAALPSRAAYVALVASKKRAEAICNYLKEDGMSEDEIRRLKYPAGLDLGASTPPEIALSILAEILQVQKQRHTAENRPESVPEKKDDMALDPVCGMTVEIASANHVASYQGRTYYFCSAGCQRAFQKEPEKYLQAEQESGGL